MGIYLCHEIHPGTAAMCADDFNMLVEVLRRRQMSGVNADPSHCWEGEDWETRFRKVAASRLCLPREKFRHSAAAFLCARWKRNWPERAMQFVDIPTRRLEHGPLCRDADRYWLSGALLQDHGHQNGAAHCRSRERLSRPRRHQHQRHPIRPRTPSASRWPAGSFEDGMGA